MKIGELVMYNLYYKIKKDINKKGFTLVELLAVIVILAIIMIIAIPAILDSLDNAKRKSFETYTSRILALADQETMKREMDGNSFGEQCFVYNITKDFELNNTGDYKGYVLLQVSANTKKYYVTMWSNDYMLISYNITENIDYSGKKKSIHDALERYDSSREEELTIQSLCNYACSVCVYDSNGESETLNGDITKIKGSTILITGNELKNKFITLAGSQSKIVKIKRSYELPEDNTKELISITNDTSSKDNLVYAWFDTDTIYFYSDATQIFLNKNCQDLFSWYTNLKDISDFVNSTKTNLVDNASYMFFKNTGIEKLDLSNWKFENTTTMVSMFNECTALKELNVSSFITNNLRDMTMMFYRCTNLKELKMNNFNTSKVTSIRQMFSNCNSLEILEISSWDTSNVTSITNSYGEGLFYNCYNLKELDLSKWNTSKINDLSGMFSGCKKLEKLNISNWNTSNIKSLSSTFATTSSLKELDLSNWNVENVTGMNSTFHDCHAKIILTNWNTKSLTSLNGAFWGTWCNLDLSSFDTSKVISMSQTFHFSGGAIFDLSSWDTSNVTSMGRMFANCGVEHVYVGPKWSVEKVTDGYEMFHEANNIHNYGQGKTKERAHVGNDGYLEYK